MCCWAGSGGLRMMSRTRVLCTVQGWAPQSLLCERQLLCSQGSSQACFTHSRLPQSMFQVHSKSTACEPTATQITHALGQSLHPLQFFANAPSSLARPPLHWRPQVDKLSVLPGIKMFLAPILLFLKSPAAPYLTPTFVLSPLFLVSLLKTLSAFNVPPHIHTHTLS